MENTASPYQGPERRSAARRALDAEKALEGHLLYARMSSTDEAREAHLASADRYYEVILAIQLDWPDMTKAEVLAAK